MAVMRAARIAWAVSAIACAILAACGDDDAPVDLGDAGAAFDAGLSSFDGAISVPVAPATPAPPAPAVLGPCPMGWSEVAPESADDVATCEPWPSGEGACPAREARFPGEAACAPIGGPCPAGEFSDDLPADAPILYVRTGATGGDGSRERPHGTLLEAAFRATAGSTIALSRGDFPASTRIPANVTLQGVCAAETRLVGSAELSGALGAAGPGVVVRDVTIAGETRGLIVEPMGSVRVENVVVDGVIGAGILVVGGTADLDRVVVRGTRTDAAGAGRGIQVQDDGRVDGHLVVVEDSGDLGVAAMAGGVAHLIDCVVRDSRGDAAGRMGGGAWARIRGRVELERCMIERTKETAIGAIDEGTSVFARDVLVRDVAPNDAGREMGYGVAANGALATLERVHVLRADAIGVGGTSGATIDAFDLVVEATNPDDASVETSGGIAILEGSTLNGARLHVRRTRGTGVAIQNAEVTASDVVVRGTDRDGMGSNSFGISVNRGSNAVLERVEVAEATNVGIGLWSNGILRDVTVSDTRAADTPEVPSGMGILVRDGVTATLERVRLDANRSLGMIAIGGGIAIEARDLEVTATTANLDGRWGRGVHLQSPDDGTLLPGPEVTLERARVHESREAGIVVIGYGTSLDATDLVVSGTMPPMCSPSCDSLISVGVGVVRGARASLTRFAVTVNTTLGVQVMRDSALTLSDGEVSGHAIGANVQAVDYDIRALTDGVRWDNVIELDTSALPVPGMVAPVME